MLEKVITPVYNFGHAIKESVSHAFAYLAEHLQAIARRVYNIAMAIFNSSVFAHPPEPADHETKAKQELPKRVSKISPPAEGITPEPAERAQPAPAKSAAATPAERAALTRYPAPAADEPEKVEEKQINPERALVVNAPRQKPITRKPLSFKEFMSAPMSVPAFKAIIFAFESINQKLPFLPRQLVIALPKLMPSVGRERTFRARQRPPLETPKILEKTPKILEENPETALVPAVEPPVGMFGGLLNRAKRVGNGVFSAGQNAVGFVTHTTTTATAKAFSGAKAIAAKTGEAVGNVLEGAKSVAVKTTQVVGGAANAALKNTREAYNAKVEFEAGLDLYPYFVKGAQAGAKAARAGKAAYDDFMSQPSSEFDPITANILDGFTKEFGKNLHYLLLNTVNLKGQFVAQKLAEMFNIVEIGGKKLAEGILQLSTPLGWTAFISNWALTLTNVGIDLRGLTRGGAIAFVSDQIDSFFIDQLLKNNRCSLSREDILYYLKKEPMIAAENNYQRLLSIAENAPEDEAAAALAEAAKLEWQALEEEFSALNLPEPEFGVIPDAKRHWTDQVMEFQYTNPKEAACKPAVIAATGLKNTLKKTIGHFLTTMPKSTTGNLIKALIEGSPVTAAEKVMHKPVSLTTKITKGAIALYNNPINTLVSHIPKPLKLVWNKTVAPANRMIGGVASDLLIGGRDESFITSLGLQNLSIVPPEQLRLNVMQRIKDSGRLPEGSSGIILQALGAFSLSFNKCAKNMLQDAGKALAQTLAKGMAVYAAKLINSGHTPEQLISGKIELSLPRKAVRVAGVGFRWGVDQAIDSTIYSAKEYAKAAQEIIKILS